MQYVAARALVALWLLVRRMAVRVQWSPLLVSVDCSSCCLNCSVSSSWLSHAAFLPRSPFVPPFPSSARPPVSCTVHDPRCTVCNFNECLQCGDPLLNSVRRSGQRRQDAPLPFDEIRRELSDVIPHMSQSRYSMDEAEKFFLVTDVVGLTALGFVRSTAATTAETYFYNNGSVTPPADGDPTAASLSSLAVTCHQGFKRDADWNCFPWPVSHVVCGHPGLFSFSSLTYSINEHDTDLRITVVRTGGGLGRATVRYNLEHNTTTVSDVTPTLHYTSSQTLVFEHGQVRKSFLLAINDDNDPELDETFRLILSEPTNGASLGNQWITQVTILDNELRSPTLINYQNSTASLSFDAHAAGQIANVSIVSRSYFGNVTDARTNGDMFVIQIREKVREEAHAVWWGRQHCGQLPPPLPATATWMLGWACFAAPFPPLAAAAHLVVS
jgi:hypothetical protein